LSDKALRVYTGSTSIITGGASGIGRALGEEIARRGGYVVLADLQIKLAEEVAQEIRSNGGRADACELDVTDFSAVDNLLRKIVEQTGRLDFMFNNAGISIYGDASLHRIEDWIRIINVNLLGVVNGVQVAYQIMLRQKFGHIINTASMAGLVVGSGSPSYTTTKHAIIGLSKTLRAEAKLSGVRVSVLCPSFVRTPILTGGRYGKILMSVTPEKQREIWEKLKIQPMNANTYAVKALSAIEKNKAIIIIPFWWKIIWWIDRLSPSLGILLAEKSNQYMNKVLTDE
jgi:NAD(P)-dependent dehydrogenase (short-subunit alcohol dehydrogenase family)